MSFAIIRTGGKQYRVWAGSTLTVEKLAGEPGQQVEFTDVLMRGGAGQAEVGTPRIDGAKVTGVIVRQDRGPRILVFKKKRRKNFRKRRGHRQYETTVRVTSIA